MIRMGGKAFCAMALCLACASPVAASEGGASFYLLGSAGPEAAVMPPFKGVYFDNSLYGYDGSAKGSRQFVIGGKVVAGLDATIIGMFPTALWVPTTNFLGGTLGLGATIPVGAPFVHVSAIVTGPLGGQANFSRRDDALVVGDPVATAVLGWKTGKLHIQPGITVNIPIGTYRENQLANLAFHRWIVDTSLALSLNDPEAGYDISGKAGITFNGNNRFTDYNTGNEFHFEASAEQSASKTFSAGMLGYYFKQLSADTGAGAALGAFKGETAALGLTAAIHTTLGRSPATIRARAFQEFDVTNRLKGKAFYLSLSLPFQMQIPTHP